MEGSLSLVLEIIGCEGLNSGKYLIPYTHFPALVSVCLGPHQLGKSKASPTLVGVPFTFNQSWHEWQAAGVRGGNAPMVRDAK